MHIIDNGKGIKPQQIDNLFEMFGKLRRSAEKNSEGIGMGLMISKKLVEINQGTIRVHSDGDRKGSVFSFTMKMRIPQELQIEKIVEEPKDVFSNQEKIDTVQSL